MDSTDSTFQKHNSASQSWRKVRLATDVVGRMHRLQRLKTEEELEFDRIYRNEYTSCFSPEELDELKEVFIKLDVNRRGKVMPEDMESVLQHYGWDLSHDEFTEQFGNIDKNGDGYVDVEEFLFWMADLKAMAENQGLQASASSEDDDNVPSRKTRPKMVMFCQQDSDSSDGATPGMESSRSSTISQAGLGGGSNNRPSKALKTIHLRSAVKFLQESNDHYGERLNEAEERYEIAQRQNVLLANRLEEAKRKIGRGGDKSRAHSRQQTPSSSGRWSASSSASSRAAERSPKYKQLQAELDEMRRHNEELQESMRNMEEENTDSRARHNSSRDSESIQSWDTVHQLHREPFRRTDDEKNQASKYDDKRAVRLALRRKSSFSESLRHLGHGLLSDESSEDQMPSDDFGKRRNGNRKMNDRAQSSSGVAQRETPRLVCEALQASPLADQVRQLAKHIESEGDGGGLANLTQEIKRLQSQSELLHLADTSITEHLNELRTTVERLGDQGSPLSHELGQEDTMLQVHQSLQSIEERLAQVLDQAGQAPHRDSKGIDLASFSDARSALAKETDRTWNQAEQIRAQVDSCSDEIKECQKTVLEGAEAAAAEVQVMLNFVGSETQTHRRAVALAKLEHEELAELKEALKEEAKQSRLQSSELEVSVAASQEEINAFQAVVQDGARRANLQVSAAVDTIKNAADQHASAVDLAEAGRETIARAQSNLVHEVQCSETIAENLGFSIAASRAEIQEFQALVADGAYSTVTEVEGAVQTIRRGMLAYEEDAQAAQAERAKLEVIRNALRDEISSSAHAVCNFEALVDRNSAALSHELQESRAILMDRERQQAEALLNARKEQGNLAEATNLLIHEVERSTKHAKDLESQVGASQDQIRELQAVIGASASSTASEARAAMELMHAEARDQAAVLQFEQAKLQGAWAEVTGKLNQELHVFQHVVVSGREAAVRDVNQELAAVKMLANKLAVEVLSSQNEAATASKHELREVAAMRGALAQDVDRVSALSKNLESILGNTCGEISKFQLAMVTSKSLVDDPGQQTSQRQLVDDTKVQDLLVRLTEQSQLAASQPDMSQQAKQMQDEISVLGSTVRETAKDILAALEDKIRFDYAVENRREQQVSALATEIRSLQDLVVQRLPATGMNPDVSGSAAIAIAEELRPLRSEMTQCIAVLPILRNAVERIQTGYKQVHQEQTLRMDALDRGFAEVMQAFSEDESRTATGLASLLSEVIGLYSSTGATANRTASEVSDLGRTLSEASAEQFKDLKAHMESEVHQMGSHLEVNRLNHDSLTQAHDALTEKAARTEEILEQLQVAAAGSSSSARNTEATAQELGKSTAQACDHLLELQAALAVGKAAVAEEAQMVREWIMHNQLSQQEDREAAALERALLLAARGSLASEADRTEEIAERISSSVNASSHEVQRCQASVKQCADFITARESEMREQIDQGLANHVQVRETTAEIHNELQTQMHSMNTILSREKARIGVLTEQLDTTVSGTRNEVWEFQTLVAQNGRALTEEGSLMRHWMAESERDCEKSLESTEHGRMAISKTRTALMLEADRVQALAQKLKSSTHAAHGDVKQFQTLLGEASRVATDEFPQIKNSVTQCSETLHNVQQSMGAVVASNISQAALVKLAARESSDGDLLKSLVSEVSKLQRSLGSVNIQSPTRTAIVNLADSSWTDPRHERIADSMGTDKALLPKDSEKSITVTPVARAALFESAGVADSMGADTVDTVAKDSENSITLTPAARLEVNDDEASEFHQTSHGCGDSTKLSHSMWQMY